MPATGFGSVQIGRLTFREAITPASDALSAQNAAAGRVIQLSGQEWYPWTPIAQLAALEDDLAGSVGDLLPVVFTNRSNLNGYYTLTDASVDLVNWTGEVITADWKLSIVRAGADTEVDVESRLTGATARNNSFSATGERWHAPPIGHYGYWSSSTQPVPVIRTGLDGVMTVYRALPTTVNPRWGCTVGNYLNGRVRLLDANSIERAGINNTLASTGWNLLNGLVQVSPLTASGVLRIAAYTGGAWQNKDWDVLLNGTTLGPPTTVSLLRNQPELAVLRMLWSQNPGRTTLDVTLRRGSRLAELYVQTSYSSTIKVVRSAVEAGTASTGYVTAASNDGAGNQYLIGSAKTFTSDTTNGGVSLASATAMDVVIGAVVAGTGAVTGDKAGDLYAQYLGAPSELIQAVRR